MRGKLTISALGFMMLMVLQSCGREPSPAGSTAAPPATQPVLPVESESDRHAREVLAHAGAVAKASQEESQLILDMVKAGATQDQIDKAVEKLRKETTEERRHQELLDALKHR